MRRRRAAQAVVVGGPRSPHLAAASSSLSRLTSAWRARPFSRTRAMASLVDASRATMVGLPAMRRLCVREKEEAKKRVRRMRRPRLFVRRPSPFSLPSPHPTRTAVPPGRRGRRWSAGTWPWPGVCGGRVCAREREPASAGGKKRRVSKESRPVLALSPLGTAKPSLLVRATRTPRPRARAPRTHAHTSCSPCAALWLTGPCGREKSQGDKGRTPPTPLPTRRLSDARGFLSLALAAVGGRPLSLPAHPAPALPPMGPPHP